MAADAAEAFNGKLYIHGGGWDSLVVRQFPTAHPSMALALLLSADDSEAPGTGELRVQLVDEDGSDLGVGAAAGVGIGLSPLHRPGQRTLVPLALTFTGIQFFRQGAYEFRLSWNGEPLARSVSFFVVTPPTMLGTGQVPSSHPPA